MLLIKLGALSLPSGKKIVTVVANSQRVVNRMRPSRLSEAASSTKTNVLVGCRQDTPDAAESIDAVASELPDSQRVADCMRPARLIEGSSAAIAITDNLVRCVQTPPVEGIGTIADDFLC